MKKEGKNKLMPILLTFILLLSAMAIMPQSITAPVFPDGFTYKGTYGLTCGDEVTYKVVNGSLIPDDDYSLWINTGSMWVELESDDADDNGDISLTFSAPGLENLGEDPIGTWTLDLHDDANVSMGVNYEEDIYIGNLYSIRLKYAGDWIDYLIYNTSYTPIEMYIYNWTGSKHELVDVDVDVGVYQPDVAPTLLVYEDALTTGIWDLDITDEDLDYRDGIGGLEYYLTTYVDDGAHNTTTAIPVMLAVTSDYPSDAVWGDDISVTGYVRDGQDNGIGGYNVGLFSPVDGGYALADTTTTYSTGRYSLSIETGYDVDSWSAGTWYIGTWLTGDAFRVDEYDMFEFPIDAGAGFVRYYSFEVDTDDSAELYLEDPDEIIDGFEQEITISAEWNNEPIQEFDEDGPSDDDALNYYFNYTAHLHITGLDGYDWDHLEEFDEDEYYYIGELEYDPDERDARITFDEIQFNESGTLTFYLTWPMDDDHYTDDYYNNGDFLPNVTGMLEVDVGAGEDMNMVVTNMPDEVHIIEFDGGDCWINESDPDIFGDIDNLTVEFDIYGEDTEDLMNASLHVSGCGLDFTIDEDDDVNDHEYLLYKDEGYYELYIAPKIGGIITITATNETEEITITKDFKVSGLSGTVTTSIGDDKEISVESSETIKVTVNGGSYATVRIGHYDENWVERQCNWEEIIGDGETPGEGLDGIFEFEVEDEDIEDGVGYFVVVAGTADLYMYEIIEIAPVHDLTIEAIDPENASQKDLTVGLDHEDMWEFKVYGPDGDVMDDIDDFWAVLIDEDSDEDNPIQTIVFKERSGAVWVADDEFIPWFEGQMIFTAVNNSGENEHDGNATWDVNCATVSYMPDTVTAGIDLENFTVEVMVVDANGDPVPEGTDLYLHVENQTEPRNIHFNEDERMIDLDEDGMGEFEIECVGDDKTWINATLGDNTFDDTWDVYTWEDDWEVGNLTCGQFLIDWPEFLVEPSTIYIGQANVVTIIALDYLGEPVEGINLTLFRSYGWDSPDPVETDENGEAQFSLEPENSGKVNVTIARGIEYVDGLLEWDIPGEDSDSVVTDTVLTITSLKAMTMKISKSPIWEEETLTITLTSYEMPVADVDVEFGQETKKTDTNGQAIFSVPDPGVESAVYLITAEKTGYHTEEKSITVIKIYEVVIIGPSTAPGTGETFKITALAKGSPLAGATISFDGKTFTTGADGSVELTAPAEEGTYTVTGSYEDYQDAVFDITITAGGIPGFELLALIAAIGVAFILLRRRR